jgi:hypothetical protein
MRNTTLARQQGFRFITNPLATTEPEDHDRRLTQTDGVDNITVPPGGNR